MDRYQAEEEIESNLRAGAVAEYVDGDTALEMLGDLVKLHCMKALPGESLQDHLRRIDTAVGVQMEKIRDQIISENTEFVMQAAGEAHQHARSDYRELTTERRVA